MSKPEVPNILMTDQEVEELSEDTYSTRGPDDYVVARKATYFTGNPMSWAKTRFGVRLKSGHYEPDAAMWIFVVRKPNAQ